MPVGESDTDEQISDYSAPLNTSTPHSMQRTGNFVAFEISVEKIR